MQPDLVNGYQTIWIAFTTNTGNLTIQKLEINRKKKKAPDNVAVMEASLKP